ncbi:MAG: DUF2807 domain-containing protein [Lutibacter sp.]|nr:MAG: DUF2807 domain-containing protein [Lutibacter sp.]
MKFMKTIVTTLIICLTIQANAFTKKVKGNGNVVTETRTTEDYEKIAVGGSFDVTLVSGKEGNLTIKIEDNLLEYLITEVNDGTLKIKWKKGINVHTRKGVIITVPFKQINAVSLAGSGNIKTNDPITSHNLELKIAGSGNMNLDIKASDLITKIAGSGNMSINGTTTNLECRIAGSGDFNSYNLTTRDVEVKIAGSGTLKATINGKISAKIVGSGNVYYKGTGTTEDVKVTGSGNVSKK